ncbi:MAG: hypothetical protein ABIJ47_04305 [Candidatus Bathyarchaeota archaeon]
MPVDLRERMGKLRESLKDLPRKLRGLPSKIRGSPKAMKEAIIAYEKSYRRGVEKYGFWWKVFNWSMWLFILTFISTAVIAFIIYLPQSQFLRGL